MWSYERDSDKLSELASREAVNHIVHVNELMLSGSADIGSKTDMWNSAEFLELCKRRVCKELDERIRVLRERSK